MIEKLAMVHDSNSSVDFEKFLTSTWVCMLCKVCAIFEFLFQLHSCPVPFLILNWLEFNLLVDPWALSHIMLLIC